MTKVRNYKTRIPEWFSLLKDGKEYTVEDIVEIAGIEDSTIRRVMINHNVAKRYEHRDGTMKCIYKWNKKILDKLISE